ncbi:MAG: membrane bound O-acyl transferase MBOAT family protein [Bacteroidetes bacterium]|nr:MAG: membrane bound O-acyl transferase MBOAT family protein [Bacteroidota bacterium]
MLFNSWSFLLFFPLVTAVYFLLPHRFRWIHLLAASALFYAAFIPAYLLILAFTIGVDYFAGIWIEQAQGRKRKMFLLFSIVANVGTLAVFKYYNFFIENANGLLEWLGYPVDWSLWNIILPVGLSFHTFQAMSYTIEVYRGKQKAERHPGIYALYVMFYPQLVAGPIERPQNLLPQFRREHTFSSQRLADGLRLMLWGLFKKVVIADRLAVYVNAVYADPQDAHYLNLLLATFFFAIQIYCDFSGYSDMAIGAAKTMGFDLMTNFRRPYFAAGIAEFWSRWHISLSTWFKDYLYIPLGGNRLGKARTMLNLAIVFLVSGFWHGAKWTFVIWGAVHAFLLISASLFKEKKQEQPQAKQLVSIGWTFLLVCFAWIFFRAGSLADAKIILHHIFTMHEGAGFSAVVTEPVGRLEFGFTSLLIALLAMLILFRVELRNKPDMELIGKKPAADFVFETGLLLIVLLFGVFNQTSFIYFQF